MIKGITGKKLLSVASLTLLFIIIIGYGTWRGRDLLFGIHMSVSGIQNNETVRTSVLNLSGTAYHAISITINGRIVSVEEDGHWNDTIALLEGYNIIDISAKDKFNRTTSQIYKVNFIKSN
ncbi:MAG: hypothetical protein WCO65_01280 [bacterium]